MKMSEMSISDILDAYVATILACGNADAQGHKIIRRAIEKRLARLAALVEKLRQDMHEAVEHCEVCRGLARASSRRCARCLTFIRRIETAAQKENDNGCTDTTG